MWIEPESKSSNIVVAAFSGTTVDSLNQSISQPLIGVSGTGFAAVAGETYAIAAAAVGPAPMVDRLRFSLGTLRLVSDPVNPAPLPGEPIALRLEADPGNPLAGSSVFFVNGFPMATNPPGLGPWTRVESFPGKRRFVVLATDSFGHRQLSSPVDVLVRVPNDDRANAIELVDSWYGSRIGSASYSTSEATADSSDPVPTTHSVWYRWRAPEAGRMKLDVASALRGLRPCVRRGRRTINTLPSEQPVGSAVCPLAVALWAPCVLFG